MTNKLVQRVGLLALTAIVMAGAVWGGEAGGGIDARVGANSDIPFQALLTGLAESIKGGALPTAFALCYLVFAGAKLIFEGDLRSFAHHMVLAILFLGLVLFAPTIMGILFPSAQL